VEGVSTELKGVFDREGSNNLSWKREGSVNKKDRTGTMKPLAQKKGGASERSARIGGSQ